MDLPTTPNDRASIGGNNPPDDLRTTLEQSARELRAAGSSWVNEIGKIETQEMADKAAAFRRQCLDLQKRIDAAKATEKRPHLDANKAIEDHWKAVAAPVQKASDLVSEKLTAFLILDRKRKEAEAEAARKVAEELQAKADAEAEKAIELMEKAERGELIGTGVNTVAALDAAEQAAMAAEKASENAERMSKEKAGAGGQYVVGGNKRSVALKTTRKVALDLPERCPEKVVAIALQKLVPYIAAGGKLDDLKEEMGRLVNSIFAKTGEVPAGCKVIETSKAV